MTVDEIKNIDLKDLIALGAFDCACGKRHSPGVAKVIIEKGAVKALPALLEEIGELKLASRLFIIFTERPDISSISKQGYT